MSEEKNMYDAGDIVREMRRGHHAASSRASLAAGAVLMAAFIYVCQPEQWIGSPVPDHKCVTLQPDPYEPLDVMLEDNLRQHPRMRVQTVTTTSQGLVVCYRSKFAR